MTLIQHLDADTPAVQYLASKDKHLAKVMAMVGPLSDSFRCYNPTIRKQQIACLTVFGF